MRIEELNRRLVNAGAKPVHAARVLRAWAQGRPLDAGTGRAEDILPRALRAALPAVALDWSRLAPSSSIHIAGDGAERVLHVLADGQTVESVILPRDGLCVSSQVGCAVGCGFCMTGRSGLLRQLGSAEIVAQVVEARQRRRVAKVVFMGMGEPSHNLDNVLEAIDFLGSYGGIAHKNLVFSTVGDRRAFERLPAGEVKPALAVSLHSTNAERRRRLLPRAPAILPEELVALAQAYSRGTGYPVQYQWTLLAGVNDGDDELDEIVRLLRGSYAVMNFIPWNRVEGTDFAPTSRARAEAMALHLYRHGILAKLRESAAQDVDGACGQLRARHFAVPPPAPCAA